MSPNYKILIALGGGLFVALRTDFSAYMKAVEAWRVEVKNNPTLQRPPFDYALCVVRAMDGIIAGLSVGLGIDALT